MEDIPVLTGNPIIEEIRGFVKIFRDLKSAQADGKPIQVRKIQNNISIARFNRIDHENRDFCFPFFLCRRATKIIFVSSLCHPFCLVQAFVVS